MRWKQAYSLYPRKMRSGKTIFYYRTYTEDGERTPGKSTGKTSKTAARAYCDGLLRRGELIQSKKAVPPLLSVFIEKEHWNDFDRCTYVQGILKRGGSYSPTHFKNQLLILRNNILPVFGKKRIDTITEGIVEKWLFSFTESGRSHSTANNALKTLKVIFKQAHKNKVLTENPVENVKPLSNNYAERGVLSFEELKKILSPESIQEVWGNNPITYTAALLAGTTAMRLGEIKALRFENIFPDYIRVSGSFDRATGKVKSTKTGKVREIPISHYVYEALENMRTINGDGFLFSLCGGEKPIGDRAISDGFNKALNRIGIAEEERKKRSIVFHSLRHGFNTIMRSRGISESQVMAVTGHSTRAMMERYSHFDPKEFTEVRKIQEVLV